MRDGAKTGEKRRKHFSFLLLLHAAELFDNEYNIFCGLSHAKFYVCFLGDARFEPEIRGRPSNLQSEVKSAIKKTCNFDR